MDPNQADAGAGDRHAVPGHSSCKVVPRDPSWPTLLAKQGKVPSFDRSEILEGWDEPIEVEQYHAGSILDHAPAFLLGVFTVLAVQFLLLPLVTGGGRSGAGCQDFRHMSEALHAEIAATQNRLAECQVAHRGRSPDHSAHGMPHQSATQTDFSNHGHAEVPAWNLLERPGAAGFLPAGLDGRGWALVLVLLDSALIYFCLTQLVPPGALTVVGSLLVQAFEFCGLSACIQSSGRKAICRWANCGIEASSSCGDSFMDQLREDVSLMSHSDATSLPQVSPRRPQLSPRHAQLSPRYPQLSPRHPELSPGRMGPRLGSKLLIGLDGSTPDGVSPMRSNTLTGGSKASGIVIPGRSDDMTASPLGGSVLGIPLSKGRAIRPPTPSDPVPPMGDYECLNKKPAFTRIQDLPQDRDLLLGFDLTTVALVVLSVLGMIALRLLSSALTSVGWRFLAQVLTYSMLTGRICLGVLTVLL